jgi:hypothetical protein
MEEEKDLFTIEMLSIVLPSCWCDGSDDFMFLDYHFTKLVDNIYIYFTMQGLKPLISNNM